MTILLMAELTYVLVQILDMSIPVGARIGGKVSTFRPESAMEAAERIRKETSGCLPEIERATEAGLDEKQKCL